MQAVSKKGAGRILSADYADFTGGHGFQDNAFLFASLCLFGCPPCKRLAMFLLWSYWYVFFVADVNEADALPGLLSQSDDLLESFKPGYDLVH